MAHGTFLLMISLAHPLHLLHPYFVRTGAFVSSRRINLEELKKGLPLLNIHVSDAEAKKIFDEIDAVRCDCWVGRAKKVF